MAAGAVLGIYLWYRKLIPSNIYPVVYLLITGLLCEILAILFKRLFHNNLPCYFYYAPLEYSGLSWFIYINIKSAFAKKYIYVSVILMWLIFVVISPYFFMGDINSMVNVLSYAGALKGVMIMPLCVIYIYHVIVQISNLHKIDRWVTIIVAIMFFYYAFEAFNGVANLYLMNYAISHHISIYDIYKEPYVSQVYVCRQLLTVKPLLFITNFIFYIVILIVLVRYWLKNNTEVAVS
ncbi:hypothetical protein [Mucilaginibacter sp. KACC 22063]|uniref:hypothetical protein n=1 Tax=Mucilaginibacter sp. KACC 22063 TaxID=3025666 RepID=UPI002365BA5E|nr:hypothetical protein [Mucilaginibacter sp. KACC 22063]WDF55380.1 hypothetical protein PQ461_20835 [Mucilaginibacter sp. KACC 22063]